MYSSRRYNAVCKDLGGDVGNLLMTKILGGYSDLAHEKPFHDYQDFAYNWGIERLFIRDNPGVGVFLDPGLGKSRITLSILDTLFNLGAIERALIVAPLRPMYTVWPDEILKWGFPQSHIILHNQHVMAMAANRRIEMINYDSIKKLTHIRDRWDIIVLDESTYAKNWASKRVSYLKKIITPKMKRIILTGTPAANSLADLFSQMFIVDGGESLGRTITRFRAEFCYQGGWQGRKWIVRNESKKSIQSAIADDVLRMDAEDHLDMPKLVEHELWVDLPEIAAKQYKRFKRELVAELSTGKVFAVNASSAYIKCRQLASGQVYASDDEGQKIRDKTSVAEFEYHVSHKEKINALCELIEELAGKPLMVFYWFKHELAELQKYKQFKKAPVIKGGGKVTDSKRIIDEWNEDKHTIILCQWAAASHGLNMQYSKCADVACLCLTDMPEGYIQAIRRLYRQGFKWDQLRIHRILARGTVDELQLERLNGKFETQTEFLNALKEHAQEKTV